jgi:glycerophosphoryl diester phosphodiesterase
LQELKKLDFGRWFDASTANERIMTLSELLAIAKKNNLSLNLEVKQDPSNTNDTDCIKLAKRVGCELSKASNDKRTILLSSFSHQVIRQLAAYCNGYALGVISEKLNSSDIDLLNEVDAFSCHLNSQYISKDDIELLRETGRQVWCYTVNEPKLFAELELVDAIFTDFPERF